MKLEFSAVVKGYYDADGADWRRVGKLKYKLTKVVLYSSGSWRKVRLRVWFINSTEEILTSPS